MTETHWGEFVRRRWKLLLNLATLVALVFLIYAIRHQLGDTFRNLVHVHAGALLLLIPIEILNYHAQAKLYQGLFAKVGNRLSYGFLYKMSLELNFVNHVFPSGGVTGISYFGVRLRKGEEITGGKATLIQVMKLALTFVSFEVLVIIGLICLAAVGRVSELTILVAGSLSTLLLVGTMGFAYIVGSQQRIDRFFTALTRGLNRLLSLVWRNPETINISRAKKVFHDFHINYQQLKRSYRQLAAPFWYALLANATEVAAIYVVYLGYGKVVNIGAVIIAYGVANFAGLVSVLPGGVGIYEGLMTAVLVTAGVPAAVSLPVTVTYRVINTLIQLPPGYYLYQRNLARGGRSVAERANGA
ncbi:MAG TPA: lysylphosphatidylglycerol synthase transmembrane domain-containing protein [Candidatus Saccharimonadales bacterium]|nr:lysylphosphatidylglycerol synthase transmembrane domain-containing protein [Candidatus Saccharimonadales bacterium]